MIVGGVGGLVGEKDGQGRGGVEAEKALRRRMKPVSLPDHGEAAEFAGEGSRGEYIGKSEDLHPVEGVKLEAIGKDADMRDVRAILDAGGDKAQGQRRGGLVHLPQFTSWRL
jgi:hypothetical protein